MAAWTKANPGNGKKKTKKDEKDKPANKKYKSDISALTVCNEEMLAAMVASNEAQLLLWETKRPALQNSSGPPEEESIRAHERAKLAVVKLQAIQKGAVKPSGKPPAFPAP